jgi:hypothetical protein
MAAKTPAWRAFAAKRSCSVQPVQPQINSTNAPPPKIKKIKWAGNIVLLLSTATGHTLQAFCAAKAGPKRLCATVPLIKGHITTRLLLKKLFLKTKNLQLVRQVARVKAQVNLLVRLQ